MYSKLPKKAGHFSAAAPVADSVTDLQQPGENNEDSNELTRRMKSQSHDSMIKFLVRKILSCCNLPVCYCVLEV